MWTCGEILVRCVAETWPTLFPVLTRGPPAASQWVSAAPSSIAFGEVLNVTVAVDGHNAMVPSQRVVDSARDWEKGLRHSDAYAAAMAVHFHFSLP